MIVHTETSRYEIDPLELTVIRHPGEGKGGFPGREDIVHVEEYDWLDRQVQTLREFRAPVVGEPMLLWLKDGGYIRSTKVRSVEE